MLKKCVHCFFIIKDKINLYVKFSSNNNLKHFHVNFTENRVRVMGNYFLLTFSPIRLNVHFGTELSVLISTYFLCRVGALRLFSRYCLIRALFMGVEVIWGHPVNHFSQSSNTYMRNIESLEPSVSRSLTYLRI